MTSADLNRNSNHVDWIKKKNDKICLDTRGNQKALSTDRYQVDLSP